MSEISKRLGLEAPEVSREALEVLADQPWPGNVRQLSNVLERAIILCEGSALRPADLRQILAPDPEPSERQRVRRALAEAEGDKRRAAEILGVSYRTLQRRVRELDLEGYPKYRD